MLLFPLRLTALRCRLRFGLRSGLSLCGRGAPSVLALGRTLPTGLAAITAAATAAIALSHAVTAAAVARIAPALAFALAFRIQHSGRFAPPWLVRAAPARAAAL